LDDLEPTRPAGEANVGPLAESKETHSIYEPQVIIDAIIQMVEEIRNQ
jgi:hypothetical protein